MKSFNIYHVFNFCMTTFSYHALFDWFDIFIEIVFSMAKAIKDFALNMEDEVYNVK